MGVKEDAVNTFVVYELLKYGVMSDTYIKAMSAENFTKTVKIPSDISSENLKALELKIK